MQHQQDPDNPDREQDTIQMQSAQGRVALYVEINSRSVNAFNQAAEIVRNALITAVEGVEIGTSEIVVADVEQSRVVRFVDTLGGPVDENAGSPEPDHSDDVDNDADDEPAPAPAKAKRAPAKKAAGATKKAASGSATGRATKTTAKATKATRKRV